MQDVSIDTIISIATLFLGGGGIGAIIGWRSQKKKARAEARQAEAEAEKTKYEAMQALRAAGNILEETHEATGTRVKVLIAEDKLWKVKGHLEP